MNMRYTLTKNNKSLPLVLIAVGLVSIIAGFATDAHRAWASLLINNFYFMALAVGGTFFVAVQYAARAGWSVGLLRVPMAMGAFLPVAAVVMLIIALAGATHLNHLYHWMDPEAMKHDEILAGKSGFLNVPFFLIRIIFYFTIWIVFTHLLRRESAREDIDGGLAHYHRSVKFSAIFLVLFAVTSSTSAWDFMMSIDSHWYSTLFGWYIFSGTFVSTVSMIALFIIYLKRNGYLENINENHLHDLGKFMFAFSVFWAYLWFSQFMLIWYANIPEEVVYYQQRWDNYKHIWICNFFINFLFPFLILMSRDVKRKTAYLMVAGVVILIGHWIDVYLMVTPGVMGEKGSIGFVEIGTMLGYLGMFIFVVLNALSKIPLVPQKHPMAGESIHHHI